MINNEYFAAKPPPKPSTPPKNALTLGVSSGVKVINVAGTTITKNQDNNQDDTSANCKTDPIIIDKLNKIMTALKIN